MPAPHTDTREAQAAALPSAESQLPEAATYRTPFCRPWAQLDSSMSLAHTAAEYMLSDALLPDARGPASRTAPGLPLDRMVKFMPWLPLLLVSLAFAQEFSSGKWLPSPSRP